MKDFMTRALGALMSLRLTVAALSLLGIVGFLGTLYQVDNGLYAAQRDYSITVPGELRIVAEGTKSRVEIAERGKRPAVVNLDAGAAETLLDRLKSVNARLTVTQ